MCTLSWITHATGYEAFFNRDELLTRRLSTPPMESVRTGVRYLAPLDGDHGGTWIVANERGVTLCVMNLYGAAVRDPGATARSRGLMLPELADVGSADEAHSRLASTDLSRYRGFTLIAFAPLGPHGVACWDGATLTFDPLEITDRPLSSSAYDAPGAARSRTEQLLRLTSNGRSIDGALLASYHRSHDPERGPYSVCMHRADAATVNYTHVTVTPSHVEMRHAQGSPCANPVAGPLKLTRHASH